MKDWRSILDATMRWAAMAGVAVTVGGLSGRAAPWLISANEGKLDLATGVTRVVESPEADSLTILDLGVRPFRVTHLPKLSNTVLGPPSNVAISPDGRLALIADSVYLDPAATPRWQPGRSIHVLDLSVSPPRVLGEVQAGSQPSGLSISPDGTFAVVANRAGGSVTRLRIQGKTVSAAETVSFTHGTNEVSDVAISPDGRFAVASVREANHLRVLRCDGDSLQLTERKISASGRPYRVVFTPDGEWLLTAGQGAGTPSANDLDAMTVIRRRGDEFQTVDYVALGSGPETIEVSPDGRWVAALLMNGSNLAPGSPGYHDHGQLVMLKRRGETFVRTQTIPLGRIPEGVAFTPDGRHLVVQGHPDRELRIYDVGWSRVSERYQRVPVPGFPSGIRASPASLRR